MAGVGGNGQLTVELLEETADSDCIEIGMPVKPEVKPRAIGRWRHTRRGDDLSDPWPSPKIAREASALGTFEQDTLQVD